MTKTVACDYEAAGPAGTTLTNGNTGGTVSIGASCTAVSTASAAFGSLAGSYTCPATNVSSRVTSTAAGGTQFAVSIKFRIPTGFATTKRIAIFQNGSAGTIFSINYNGSTNRVQIQNAAGAGTLTLLTTLTLNTWYRVEVVATVATASTGVINANVYANEGTTPLVAAVNSTAYDLGTTGLAAIQHGINSNGTTVAAAVDIDSVRFDPGGVFELGPEALAAVNSDLDARWAVRNAVSSDLDGRWRVRNVVTSDLDGRWLVRNAVSSDLDARWRVANLVDTLLDVQWRVRTLVDSLLDARWTVRNRVSSDLSASWRVYPPPRDVDVVATLSAQPERAPVAAQERIVVTLGAQDG